MAEPTHNAPCVAPARVPKLALTIKEAGPAVGLSERTIEELAKLGKIPVVRHGRRVLIPVAALRKLLNKLAEEGGEL